MPEAAVSPGRTRGMGELIEVAGKTTELAPFGRTLAELAAERPEIVGLTADMGRYSDILPFRDAHPTRFFNVGMAEQSLVMVAAGLSRVGKIAYCTTYSVFITRRAYDFVAIAGAHSKANVKIFAGMPGLVNGYGATHQATEDLNMMRGIADITIIDPCDATELKQVVRAVADIPGTVYVRTLRGKVPVELPSNYKFEVGKAKLLRDGRDVGIISTGYMSARARDAAEAASAHGVEAGVLHVSTIKPFDREVGARLCATVRPPDCRRESQDDRRPGDAGGRDAVRGRNCEADDQNRIGRQFLRVRLAGISRKQVRR